MNGQLNKLIKLIPLSFILLVGCSNTNSADPNKQLRIYNNINRYDLWRTYHPKTALYLNGVLYYGTYNNYDVVYYRFKGDAEIDATTEYVLNDCFFHYSSDRVAVAVNDNEMITLEEAYNNHIINNDSIALINKYHTSYYEEYNIKLWNEGGFFDFTSF